MVEHPLMVRRGIGSIPHDGPIELFFLFQPVVHDWCNKGMYYPYVCRMVHIKEPLLLIGKSRPCSVGSGFPLLLSEWCFTIMSDTI